MKCVDLRQHNDRHPRTAYRGGCDPAAKYIRGETAEAIFAAHLAREALAQ
ncbi:hypothetical protein [Escherichia coli]